MSFSNVVLFLASAMLGLAGGVALASAAARRSTTILERRATAAEHEVVALTATLDAERAAAESRLQALRDAEADQSERFQALAAHALRSNNEAFLALADQRLRTAHEAQAAELGKRTTEVQQLVAPIQETLGKVAESIRETDKSRAASHAGLMEQVRIATETSQSLRSETATLVKALQAPQARGAWGEMQLRRVVELAGMLEHCDFTTQVSVTTEDGTTRPDLVVHLAGGKQIVVDAKVSLAAFLDSTQSEDVDVSQARLVAHARHMRDHVNALASKSYWRQFSNAPDFVVLFVPGESFLVHALAADPGLQEHAMEQQVIIATPSTLLSLLRTVSYAWKQEALADNARVVFDLGRELYDRLGTLGGHVDKLGRAIGTVVKDYNTAVGSLEGRVLTSARRLKDLKFVDDELPAPRVLDAAMVRPLTSHELLLPPDVPALEHRETSLDRELSTDDRYGIEGPAQATLDMTSGSDDPGDVPGSLEA